LILAAKLSLVALSLAIAAWAGRIFGHRGAGLVSGLPMIVGPLVGLLLIDLSAERVARICITTQINVPACVAYIVSYSWVCGRLDWWRSSLVAGLVFFSMSALIQGVPAPDWIKVLVSLTVIAIAPRMMPRGKVVPGGVAIPRIELACRIGAALAIAAAVLLLAAEASPVVSAILMTFPISGAIMPAFTRALYGADATRAMLRGFATGMNGLSVFFLSNALLLPVIGKWAGFVLASLATVAYAALALRLGQRRA
jgi:hypothetical protein